MRGPMAHVSALESTPEPTPNLPQEITAGPASAPYNHLRMQLSSDVRIENGMLAAIALRNETPRQGVPSKNPALHLGIDACNSTLMLGLQSTAALNRIGSRSTGKERDTESGLDLMGARYYASTMGRFMSPDPVFASPERLADPQQWNMYSYVRNNPLSLTDPTGLDFNLSCDKNNGSTCVGGLQGQMVDGKFQATDVDMNKQGDASAGYSDQFGNNYTGTFDQNNGVSFTNTDTGATSSNSRFIDGSDQTNVNGSGSMFGGTQGIFNSNCGGSCAAKGSLFDLPGHAGAVGNAEKMIGKSFEDNLNFFGGHGKSTSYRTGEDQLTHVVAHTGGATAIHFEGHPPGRDLVNFVLHQVDAIRDSANHQSSKEPKLP